MIITGRIIDQGSRDPVPGATVELWNGSVMLNRGAADGNGFFSISTASSPNKIVISSATYLPAQFSVNDVTQSATFEMIRNIREIDPVIVTAKISKKTAFIGFAVLLTLSVLLEKNKL